MPGRNDRCPCGSGKKFKKCCWSRHSEKASVRARADTLIASYKDLVAKIDQQAQAHFGLEFLERWSRKILPATHPDDRTIAFDYLTFHCPSEDFTSLAAWLLEHSKLSTQEAELLKTALSEPFSLYQVVGSGEGSTELQDALRHQRRTITSSEDYGDLLDWYICGKVVDHEGLTVLISASAAALDDEQAEYVIKALKKSRAPLKTATMLKPKEVTRLLDLWGEARDRSDLEEKIGGLMNFDGEPILFVTETFTFDPRRLNWLRQALAKVPGLREDSPSAYSYCPGAATSEGTVTLEGGRLVIEANSVGRSQRLMVAVGACCGDLLVYEGRQEQDVTALLADKLAEYDFEEDDFDDDVFDDFDEFDDDEFDEESLPDLTPSWAINAYLAERANTVSAPTLWRDRNFLELMQMALNDKGPKAFSITVSPGERFAEIVTSRVLADCLDLVLDYAREMMLQNTEHKSWKSLITTLKGFYRWLGQTEVITDSQARAALQLLKNP